MQTVLLQPLLHRNTENIGIYFEKHAGLQQLVRRQPGAKWSQSHQCWYIPLGEQNYLALLETLKPVATVNVTALRAYLLKKQKISQLSPAPQERVVTKSIAKTKPVALTKAWALSDANLEALTLFVQRLQLKAYSPSTITTYRNEFIQLLKILKQKPVDSLTTDDLKRYMVFAMKEQHITENTAHSRLNAFYPVGLKIYVCNIFMFTYYLVRETRRCTPVTLQIFEAG
jgi:hypothetical protein